jgi:filamentous hemagglutinin
MNAGLYRLVFNTVRGMLVAVEESARTHGHSQGLPARPRERPPRQASGLPLWFAARPIAFAALCAFGMQPLSAQAQASLPITPDKSGTPHPVVTLSAAGIPVVNINAPGKGHGVSNNRFTQYNVGKKGVVIANNGQAASTQIAGWVQGNPFIGNTPAKLILFQVTGGANSQLLGPTEIAGRAAPFILANPAGITCAGCGFINVPRVTLTTGTPTFNADGSLSGFDVKQGALHIGAEGLSASNSAIDLIARAMTINAQLWAQSIDAVAGANQVDYATLAATPQAGAGPTPQFAIDMQALGSMYGNGAVRMIGTEAGVGVRDAGGITSLNGEIHLSANGDVTIEAPARLQSAGATRIATAGNLDHAGSVVASDALEVNAAQQLTNTGTLSAGTNATLSATGVSNAGTIVASADALDLRAASALTNSGTLASGADASLNAASVVNHGLIGAGVNPSAPVEGNVSQPGSLTLTTHALSNSGALRAGANLTLNTAHAVLDGGSVSAAQALTVSATQALSNRQGTLASGGALRLSAGQLDNTAGTLSSTAGAHITSAGAITNTGGTIAANDTLALSGSALDNRQGTIGSVNESVRADLSGAIDNTRGKLLAKGDMTLTGTRLANTQGTVSGTNVALNTGLGTVDNTGGLVSASHALMVQAGALVNQGGTLQAADALTVNTHGHAFDNRASGQVIGGAVTLDTGDLANDTGLISAARALTLSAASVSNRAGSLVAGEALTLTSAGAVSNAGGQIGGNGEVSILGTAIDNTAGAMYAGGTLNVSGTTLTNAHTAGATVTTATGVGAMGAGLQGRSVVVSASQIDNTRGQILADTTLTLAARALINDAAGHIETPGALTLTGLAEFTNAGSLNGGTSLTLDANTLTNTGTLQSGGNLSVSTASTLTNLGQMTAGGDLTAQALGALTNAGTLSAVQTANLSAASLTNTETGKILSNVATRVAATGDIVNAGLIDGGITTLTVGGTLTNTGRVYGDSVSLGARAIVNDANAQGVGGVIASRGDMDLGAGSLTNQHEALIYAQGEMRIGGALDANGHATGTADTVTNHGAQIQSGGAMTIDAGTLSNLNANFQFTTVTTGTGTQIWFTVPGSTEQYGPGEVLFWQKNSHAAGFYGEAWQRYTGDDDQYRIVTPSARYPFAEYGTSTQPAPQGRFKLKYEILPGATQWALFGVASPGAIPDYVGPPASSDSGGGGSGSSGGKTPTPKNITLSGNDAITFCRGVTSAACAPVNQWVKDSQSAYDSLSAEISAYNTDFNRRTHDAWTAYHVDTRTTTPTVTASQPGQIIAGGDLTMRLNTGLNDASQIVAGGNLQLIAHAFENRQPTAQQVVTATGTATHSHVESGGAFSGDERKNDTAAYTPAPVITTLDLPILAPDANGASPVKQTAREAASAQGASGSVNTVSAASGGATVRTVSPNLTLPNNALYQLTTTPGSPFLIVTDPRFAHYRSWLSGEFMLTQLRGDSKSIERFIGDGFYQQQLIQQQILAATGLKTLGDYTSNEAQYQALMNAGVAAASAFHLNVGTALTEAQMAALQRDIVWFVNQTVTLPDGSQQTVLVPQVYLVSNALAVSGAGTIVAGRNVSLSASQLSNSGAIASRKVTLITGDTLTNRGTLSGDTVQAVATQDLNHLGGLIQGNMVSLAAGHDLNLTSTTQSTQAANGEATRLDRIATIQAGTLAATAGNDLNATAAAITASGNATLAAGHDVNLATVTQSSQDHVAWDGQNHAEHAASINTGTQIMAGGNATLIAGHDVNAKAAYVEAGNAVNLVAGHDVNLTAGQQSTYANDEHFQKESGFLSSTSTHTLDTIRRTDALGTTLSGHTVNVAAGHDVTVSGSTVAGTGDVGLSAGHDLNVTTAQTSSSETHFKEVKQSGFGTSGGIGVSYGTNDQKRTTTDAQTDNVGSLIGSTAGSVRLSAGNDLHVTGSDLIAAQNITGVGANVTLDAAQGTSRHTDVRETQTTGFTLGLGGSVGDAVNNAVSQTQAATHGPGDGRAKALHGIAAAGNAAMAVAGVTGGAMAGSRPSIAVQLSFGSASSKDTFTETRTTNTGASVLAGGTAAFVATGNGTPGSGNVTIAGSNVNASDVLLAARNQVNLVNTTDTDSTRSTNESKSASVGVSFGTNGLGVSASMANAHGDGNSDARITNNAHVNGANSVTLISGGDTNIIGANVNGGTVMANVGGNLNIASVQDTTQSRSHQESSGGGFSVSQGGGGASFSSSHGDASGSYVGVNEQAGIQAGDGGFNLNVRGNTDLAGAYIASAAEASKNSLTTGTLSFSDLANHSDYSASSSGFSAGAGIGMTGKADGPGSVSGAGGITPMLSQHDSGSSEASTRSAIAAGSITVTDAANQTQDLASLNRDTSNLNGAVSQLPDLKALLDQQADMMNAVQAAGQVTAQTIGTYADQKHREAQANADMATGTGNPELAAQWQAQADSWDEGGGNRIALHVGGGALIGGLGGGGLGTAAQGAAGAGLAAASAGKLNDVAGDIGGVTGNVVSNVIAGTGGFLVGGNVGAVTAANADLYNRQLHPEEKKRAKEIADKSDVKYTQAQIEDQLRIMGVMANGQQESGAPETLIGQAPSDSGARWMSAGTTADGKPILTQVTAQADPQLQSYILSNYATDVPNGFTYDTLGGSTSWNISGPFTKFDQSDVNFMRSTTADAAGMVSTNAGRFGAATATAANIPSPYSPGFAAASFTATVTGMVADVITQMMKPDVGQYWVSGSVGIAANAASEKFPGLSPAINEAANTMNNSRTSQSTQDFINSYWQKIINSVNGTGKRDGKN